MKTPRYHVIFDIDQCQPDKVRDQAGIGLFLQDMVRAIGMKVLSGPIIAEGVPENPGLSGFVILDFSHAAVHTFTTYNDTMIDIFSCRPFDRSIARDLCLKHFATPESAVRSQEIWWQP